MTRIGMAVGLLLTSVTALGAVSRGPYIQSVDEDSAIIGLRLDAACPAEIHYGEGDALDRVESSEPSATQHFIELEGLSPATVYNFSVEACGEPTGKTGSFRTASEPDARRVHFAAVGDLGTGDSAQRAVAQAMAKAQPEFWLALGDNAYSDGTDSEFSSNFFAPMAELLSVSPVFAVPGNHEYNTAGARPYFEAFALPHNNPAGTERYYSFDWGPLHVAALDSNTSLEVQKRWLEADLAASQAPWKLVMVHHPPYSTGEHRSDLDVRALGPVFEKHGVDLVLSGHDHDYERTQPLVAGKPVAPDTPGAVTYMVVGSGGAGLRDWASDAAPWTAFRDNTEHGYLEVQIDEGTLVAQFVTPDGSVVDTFTKEKKVPEGPDLALEAEPAAGTAPLQSHLKVNGSNGAVVAWSFGDGANMTGSATEVTHTYRQPGIYTATAVVRDILSQTHHATTRITVLDAQGNPGPEISPAPPAEPPGGFASGKFGCVTAGAGLLGLPIVLLAIAAFRRRQEEPMC